MGFVGALETLEGPSRRLRKFSVGSKFITAVVSSDGGGSCPKMCGAIKQNAKIIFTIMLVKNGSSTQIRKN